MCRCVFTGERERRFRVYEEAPGFRPAPRVFTGALRANRESARPRHHLGVGDVLEEGAVAVRVEAAARGAGAYTRPLFSST